MQPQRIRPIKAWAVVKDGKLNAMEIYEDKEVETFADEQIIRVIITPYEDTKSV